MNVDNGRKQNILIVHNYYQIPGGEDTVVANEKKMLEEHGHKVILYTRNNSELKKMSIIRKALLPITTIFNYRSFLDIRRIIETEKIDIVHVHNTLNLISPAVYYASISKKIPVVQTIHNFRLLCPGATFYRDGHICEDCVEKGLMCAVKYNCYRGSKMQTAACVVSTMLHRMTGIYGKINYICLTDFNKDKLLTLKQIKSENVFVKPNYVAQFNRIISEKERKNQFVFAGRLDRLKGIDSLFKAWKLIGKELPKLIVCGTGPMEEWCKSYIRQNKLMNIDMVGVLPNEEVKRIIANSKALILPTKWYEGFPMTVLEAYSTGTPIIGSDIGNVGSVIDENICGLKIDSNSPEDIVSAVTKINCSSRDIINMFNSKYGEESNYEQLIRIYRSIQKLKNTVKDDKK